jgi:hypothetical protein
MACNCEYIVDYKSVLSIFAGVMLIASEIMAVSKKTKANGIFHLILIYLEKKFRNDEENPGELLEELEGEELEDEELEDEILEDEILEGVLDEECRFFP